MLGRDLKFHLVLVCVSAGALVLGAIWQLRLISQSRQTAAVVAREGVVERIHSRLREVFIDEDKAADAASFEVRCRELREVLDEEEGVRSPKGFFVWRAKPGIEAAKDIPPAVGSAIAQLKTMSDWDPSSRSRKKPAMSGMREFAGMPVVWARDGKRNGSVYGMVFEEDPVMSDFLARALWPVGLVMAVLLTGLVLTSAGRLRSEAEKARKDSEMKSTFLNNTSHELKTPLAGIGLWAEMLQAGMVKSEQLRHGYDIIVNENARMKRLVDNLLDYSRLEQGRRRYVYAKVDLGVLAAEVVDLVRGDFAQHGISLRVGGDVGTQERVVAWADLDATKQIIVNLVGNAAKYAAAGGPVEVVVAGDGDRARVAVLDRGPGMSAEARKHAFERFWRGSAELTATAGGLGLGLSISDALAKDMDGRLSVATREGGGCVFALELPIPQ